VVINSKEELKNVGNIFEGMKISTGF